MVKQLLTLLGYLDDKYELWYQEQYIALEYKIHLLRIFLVETLEDRQGCVYYFIRILTFKMYNIFKSQLEKK